MVKEVQVRRYMSYLRQEIRNFFASDDWLEYRKPIESIYFGGGTPSVLSPEQISGILSEFPSERFSDSIEICLEANPEDITKSWSAGVLLLGVNRISLGVQTLNPDSLMAIRRSAPDTVDTALQVLVDTGHQNVNVDFILGLPHVRSGGVIHDIRYLHEKFSNIRHTSVYFLEK